MGWGDFKKKLKKEVNKAADKAADKVSYEFDNLLDEIAVGAKKLGYYLNKLGDSITSSSENDQPLCDQDSCAQETGNIKDIGEN